MDKSTKRKTYNIYNKDIIRKLKKKYGTSPHFIYASLRGDRTSETSIKICEDYRKAEIEINKTLAKI
ncbi:hypothetical protein [Riemerella anatipestifer]|uniref:Uncharacterized protein n=1 Tax=Riemerella anatipestifer TaxID=34085 RepID=A0AAP6LN12_RIEAN|nr:hypothetical protein [Riemerella anatipestifer]MCU7571494.1 hypothetical protein [Riemerella anatipestifer]MDY3513511.1 hypothetical protein [Riemerella anatipestifer]